MEMYQTIHEINFYSSEYLLLIRVATTEKQSKYPKTNRLKI